MAVTLIPKPSLVFIDKMSVTLHVDKAEHGTVKGNCINLVDCGYAKKGKYSDIYKNTLYCTVSDNCAVMVINYEPHDIYCDTHRFIRIEFNSSKANLFIVKHILDMVIKNGYNIVMKYGKLTHAELATDINYLHTSHTIIDYPKYSKGALYYNKDYIETIYIGSLKSDNNIKAYNKTEELIIKNLPHKTGNYNDVVRIEVSMSNIGLNISELPNIKNPFNQLKIAAYPKHYVSNDYQLATALLASSVIGYALYIHRVKKIYPYIAKEIEYKILKHAIKGWWNPDDIWKGVQNSVDKLLPKS